MHGGACDQCGVDFLKYVMAVGSQMECKLRERRERTRARSAVLRQILLLPLTGGYSLIKYLRERREN
jgi:hypothetical protein